jgi:N-dimethylarginine dimethylaminohydrolase
MTGTAAKPRFLMCPPEHFGVSYAINPWMDPPSWARHDRTLVAASRREWSGLRRTLAGLGAAVELVPPVAGLPDLVFTANAAVVLDRTALLARFRHAERRGEEAYDEAALRALQTRGVIDAVATLPDGLVLEGAGDCVWDEQRNLFWTGHGPRSSPAARGVVADWFGVETVALELIDPRFYHLDTALCPLSGGEVIVVPNAFTACGMQAIRERVPSAQRIEVGLDDACRLAVNAVCVGNTIVMAGATRGLRDLLAERGYKVAITPLPSFRRSGGSAFCLTLRLDRRSGVGAAAASAAVA